MSNLAEIFEVQNTIINMQADIIRNLLDTLMQHIIAEEAEQLSCAREMDNVAMLKERIHGEEWRN